MNKYSTGWKIVTGTRGIRFNNDMDWIHVYMYLYKLK